MAAKSAGPQANIVLIGFMGCGKTEVGRRLAARTGRNFVDTDALIEDEGLSMADIFAAEGESGFRRRERKAVERAARSRSCIIATGGGAVLDPGNARALKKTGVLVYLDVGFEDLAQRLIDAGGRPMLDSPDKGATESDDGRRAERARRLRRIRTLLNERSPVYESVADVVIPTEGLDGEGVAREIARRLDVARKQSSRPKYVEVEVEPSYRVSVGRGILRQASVSFQVPEGAERLCVVSHPRVNRLWGSTLGEGLRATGLETATFTFPEGEEKKTLDTAARLYRRIASKGFHRTDLLLALGGGVVGDVTGFVASTYARGIPLVQVPTTLLAMVDAAIGGKTAVNLPEGKNLVGTFHQPLAVLCDMDVLTTLPQRELRGGLAEVMKYALIDEPDLGELVLTNRTEVFARDSVLEPVVLRSAAIKARVVAADERESGPREVLNYGHTLGHALESLQLSRSHAWHHGEAISVGMHFAAWVSVLSGLADKELVDEHVRLLSGVGLPTTAPRLSWDDVKRYMRMDKKYRSGIRLVLLSEPGRPSVQDGLPDDVLEEALRRVSA